jgi:hypothetical protein
MEGESLLPARRRNSRDRGRQLMTCGKGTLYIEKAQSIQRYRSKRS